MRHYRIACCRPGTRTRQSRRRAPRPADPRRSAAPAPPHRPWRQLARRPPPLLSSPALMQRPSRSRSAQTTRLLPLPPPPHSLLAQPQSQLVLLPPHLPAGCLPAPPFGHQPPSLVLRSSSPCHCPCLRPAESRLALRCLPGRWPRRRSERTSAGTPPAGTPCSPLPRASLPVPARTACPPAPWTPSGRRRRRGLCSPWQSGLPRRTPSISARRMCSAAPGGRASRSGGIQSWGWRVWRAAPARTVPCACLPARKARRRAHARRTWRRPPPACTGGRCGRRPRSERSAGVACPMVRRAALCTLLLRLSGDGRAETPEAPGCLDSR
mmetsp:Transcript_529/g.1370  ORF Transcript_529/g.1370 Transcript_529/m.1370 type:complete len:325 (+) Transcript_529:183-1157(+)